MDMIVAPPTWVFLWAVLLGAALGVCYDVFRILRIAIPSGRILVFFEDLLFFLIVAAATFEFYQLTTDGIVRGYVLIGELLGFALYYFTIGALVFRAATAIIHLIQRIIGWLVKVFLWPFRKLFAPLIRKLVRQMKKPAARLKKLCKKRKNSLQKKGNLLYNHYKTKKAPPANRNEGKPKWRKRRSKRKKGKKTSSSRSH
ncbi:putative spore cortex biosynthesis protein YabQ [[Clostridium] methylpentosum DSM 5476]|uniref:Putative spore cortex biosynthesis protein YabQ n=1 Tax=[Clostridium] methylpentosum DSM 5476 TaxID=537013 RepID=C0EBG7_9FIRM|nr:putative spore cortex biosynthesis protein YabQ [[Clostridium] methylpentosum DSM 5476]